MLHYCQNATQWNDQPHPDRYWRYRAEFGFQLPDRGQLMRQTPGNQEAYEAIFVSLIGDVERGYALNPAEAAISRSDITLAPCRNSKNAPRV